MIPESRAPEDGLPSRPCNGARRGLPPWSAGVPPAKRCRSMRCGNEREGHREDIARRAGRPRSTERAGRSIRSGFVTFPRVTTPCHCVGIWRGRGENADAARTAVRTGGGAGGGGGRVGGGGERRGGRPRRPQGGGGGGGSWARRRFFSTLGLGGGAPPAVVLGLPPDAPATPPQTMRELVRADRPTLDALYAAG